MNKRISSIIKQLDFNLAYARALVDGVPEEQMAVTPSDGLENHPAFTVGHLVSGSAGIAEDLGAEFEMPDGWAELFLRKGPGDPRMPESDTSKYPSKEELLNEFERQHEKVKALLSKTSDEDLEKELKWRFSSHMPTLYDMLIFMCVNHEAMHLGQMAAWRRAMGYPSALAVV